MDIKKLLKELTLEEKALLVSGTEFWKTNAIPRLNIPSIFLSDGPHGLRKQSAKADNLGINDSELCTCFPPAATVASSWNINNAKEIGSAIANEALYFGANVVLGPGVNIKKNPLCGRNFEYYSEDPYLAGEMGAAWVKGIQSKGIGTSVKHFAANNYENFRSCGDSVVDERALNEIYLKAFEKVIKQSKPYTVMSAYNKINGQYCASNKKLLTEILRDKYNFDGLVMSDWGGVDNRPNSIKAGLDLEMPGDCRYFRESVINAVNNNELNIEDLDNAVINVLKLIDKFSNIQFGKPFDKLEHHKLAGKIATDCAVLLKNDGLLPLNRNEKYLVIGDLFVNMRYQGAGSSQIKPTMLTSPKQAFNERGISYEYEQGYKNNNSDIDKHILNSTLLKANNYDNIIVVCGLTDFIEGEGFDRASMKLPTNQIALINELVKLNKQIVLVIFGGSPVEIPFIDGINAILNMYLPGQNGGQATAALLFGECNPSGKLAETWPLSYDDVPFGIEYSKDNVEVYHESIYVGYRYYDTANKNVLFPFGFGLSYSNFEYSDINVNQVGENIEVCCSIFNKSKYDGAEVVQLYVKNKKSNVFKANKELHAFIKVYLAAGQTESIKLSFNRKDLSYFNVIKNDWILEEGEYIIEIGSSSKDIRLNKSIFVEGEQSIKVYSSQISECYSNITQSFEVQNDVYEQLVNNKIPLPSSKLPITIDSRLCDFKMTFFGRIVFKLILKIVIKKPVKKGVSQQQKESNIKSAYIMRRMMETSSIRFMFAASAGRLTFDMANGLVALANGKLINGIKLLTKKTN